MSDSTPMSPPTPSTPLPSYLWKGSGEDLEYDEALGYANGVPAYSNRDDGFFSGEKHFLQGVHCGFKWQCVEYARRYMLIRKAIVFGDCGRASEIFAMTSLTKVESGETIPWGSCKNGGSDKPLAGDTIIYPFHEKYLPWGHVGVISHVEWFDAPVEGVAGRNGTGEVVGVVGIAEQNQASKSWADKCYGRLVPIVRRVAKSETGDAEELSYTLEEPESDIVDCLGWKHLPEDVPERDHSEPLRPLSSLREPRQPGTQQRSVCKPAEKDGSNALGYDPVLTEEQKKSKALVLFRDSHPSLKDPNSGSLRWPARYAPQDGVGELYVGNSHKTMKVAALALKHVFDTKTDAEIAGLFDLSDATVVPLIRNSVQTQCNHGHGQWFSRVDFSYNGKTRNLLQRVASDDIEFLVESAAFQDRVADESGHPNGFSPSSIAGNIPRSLAHLAKAANRRHGLHGDKKTKVIHFIDISGSNEYQRAKSLFLYEQTIQGNSDVEDKDSVITPKWVTVDSLKLDEASGVVTDADGVQVRLAWKTAPWAEVFALPKDSATRAILFSKEVDVYQPLWTAIPQSPKFVPLLRDLVDQRVFTSNKDHPTAEDVELEEMLNDLVGVDEAGAERGSGPFSAAAGNLWVSGKEKVEREKRKEDEPLVAAVGTIIQCQGYFTAAIYLESAPQKNEEDLAKLAVTDCNRPSILRFIFDTPSEEETGNGEGE